MKLTGKSKVIQAKISNHPSDNTKGVLTFDVKVEKSYVVIGALAKVTTTHDTGYDVSTLTYYGYVAGSTDVAQKLNFSYQMMAKYCSTCQQKPEEISNNAVLSDMSIEMYVDYANLNILTTDNPTGTYTAIYLIIEECK